MAEGIQPVDFIGISTGQDPEGLSIAALDVGPGFFGFIDFTGVPVGYPPERSGTGKGVAGAATNAAEAHKGRRNTARYHPVAVRMMYDSLLRQLSINEAKLKFKIQAQTLAEMNARYKKELFEHNRTVLSAVVLSEL